MKRTGWILAFILVCSAMPSPAASPTEVEASPCNEIASIEAILEPGRILLLGEIHGTREAPAFVGDVVCHALAAGLEVTVALELPQEDQERLDAFLASRGTPKHLEEMYSSFWTKDYQDGRSSKAMSSLIASLARLHRGGKPVHLVLIDRPELGPLRDEAMAEADLRSGCASGATIRCPAA